MVVRAHGVGEVVVQFHPARLRNTLYMNIKRALVALVDLGVWYAFIYYWLHTIRAEDVTLWLNSLILLVMCLVGLALIPFAFPRGKT